MSYTNGPKIVTNGLVLYLDAGNSKSYPGSGTAWNDLSGNNNNGTLVNGVGYSSGNGGSLSFDGSNDYVSVADSHLLNQTTNLSISCWINFNVGSINSRTIFCGKGTGNSAATTQYWLEKLSNNSINFYCSITIDRNLNSNFIVTNNLWYNIVGTYNGSVMRLYVNGLLRNSLNITGSITTTNTILGIGRLGTFNALYSNALISNFCFYNQTLSTNQVLQNYNALKGRFGL